MSHRCFSLFLLLTCSIFSNIGLLPKTQAMCLNTAADSTSSSSSSSSLSSLPAAPPLTIRLHFVRHGETEGNHAGVVLGQIHSPLTQIGIQQARAAHTTIGSHPYWRCYVSNQERAFQTAYYLLYDETPPSFPAPSHNKGRRNNNIDEVQYEPKGGQQPPTIRIKGRPPRPSLILEPRLRERAKGVREGRDKKLSYQEAMALFELEDTGEEIRKLETEQDVWSRVHNWLLDVWTDAYRDYESKLQSSMSTSTTTNDIKDGSRGPAPVVEPFVYDVLAVSHSGTMRTTIENMVGSQLPPDLEREETDRDGNQVGRLIIPNTSVTTIELSLPKLLRDFNRSSSSSKSLTSSKQEGEDEDPWEIKLIHLNNVSHLERIKSETANDMKELSPL